MKHTSQTLYEWLDRIEEEGKRFGLTSWESDFVQDMRDKLDERGTLSERQVEVLEKIYTERTR